MKNKFYITTPIYYVNAEPHIGHTYTTVAADVLARYHRMIGIDTFFATGTDEHGAKIAQKAEEAGESEVDFTNKVAKKFQLAWEEFNISNNRFIRTSEESHKKSVQNALQYMYDKGDIYKDKYQGLYCQGCEQFKNKKDLVDGKCPDHQTVPEKISEETYVFRMSKYAKQLEELIKKDELKIRPIERKNEIVSFFKEGLKDISFSRKNVKWGIPLPWDESHTAYVWSDAFLNYLTILNWDGKGEQCPKMFPPDVQLMSKDILRVHATIWPAMLLSLDLLVQKNMFVHGFFLINGKKMSKSIGNVISPWDLKDRYGVDGARYLLMSATTFGRDGDISWEKFDEKYNADLANGLGNLLARSITLVKKMQDVGIEFSKCLERPRGSLGNWGGKKFDKEVEKIWKNFQKYLDDYKIDKALEMIINHGKYLDNYISDNKPWQMIKEGNKEVAIIMYNVLERLRHIAFMLSSFLPETAEKILKSIGLNLQKELKKDFKKNIKFGLLSSKTKVKKSDLFFPRI